MPKFKINFAFDGAGYATIEAENEAEAKELFLSGEFDAEVIHDQSENYIINSIETL